MVSIIKTGNRAPAPNEGFTLIELLIVMAIIAVLLTLVTPQYFKHVDKAKEAVLKQDLAGIRNALDKFYADTGTYPSTLSDLVSRSYIRKVPIDPFTGSAESWILVSPPDPKLSGIYDIHSGTTEVDASDSSYGTW